MRWPTSRHVAVPPVPEVWPRENPGVDAMADRFAQELAEVHGEAFRCPRWRRPAENWPSWPKRQAGPASVRWTGRCAEICLAGLAPERVRWADPRGTPQNMAELSPGVIEADYLLADTGSA